MMRRSWKLLEGRTIRQTVGLGLLLGSIVSATHAQTVTVDTTQAGGTFTLTGGLALGIGGPTNPLFTLSAGATTQFVEALVVGAKNYHTDFSPDVPMGNGQLLIIGGSTMSVTRDYPTLSPLLNMGTYGADTTLNGEIEIGLNAGTSGTITVAGVGSTLTTTGYYSVIDIGANGNGTLQVQDGGHVINQEGHIGRNTGSVGNVTVSGAGSTWTNSSYLGVGYVGHGTMTVQNAGLVTTTGNSEIASIVGSVGTATVTGAGSNWNTSGDLIVSFRGRGTLNIQDGGQVNNVNGYLGKGVDSYSTVTVTGTGSKWTNTANLYVGYDSTSNSALNITSGGLVLVNGTTYVGTGGIINLRTGGTLKTGTLNTGGDASHLNWTGGTLLITGTSGNIPNVPLNGTLGGVGKITNSLTVHGTLSAGMSIGTLSFLDADLTLAPGAAMIYEFNGNSADLVAGEGASTLVLGSNITLNLVGSDLPQTLTLFSGFSNVMGLENLNSWTININGTTLAGAVLDTDTPGTIALVSVPEPHAASLLAVGGLTLLWQKKRKRNAIV